MTVFYPNTQGLVVHSIISLIKLLAEDSTHKVNCTPTFAEKL